MLNKSTKNLNITNLDHRTYKQQQQEEMNENGCLKQISELATANVSTCILNHDNKPIVYLQTVLDIQEGEQLGISYGSEYWIAKETIPQYFDKNGNIIKRNLCVTALNDLLKKYTPPEAEEVISKNDALHRAAFAGSVYDVKLLLFEYGASINDQEANDHNRTPLHIAVIGYAISIEKNSNDIEERKAVIKLLVDKNPNCDKKDKSGSTALHYAVKRKLQDIAIILLNYGVDVKNEDRDEKKSFDYDPMMAQKIFERGFKEKRPELLSVYKFNKVSESKIGHWKERKTEEIAGLYCSLNATSQILIFFGEKDKRRAISVTNYTNSIEMETIKAEETSFDKVNHCYILQKNNSDLSKLLAGNNITHKIRYFKDNEIVIVDYIFHEGQISPRIYDSEESELENFYGELIGHSVQVQTEKMTEE